MLTVNPPPPSLTSSVANFENYIKGDPFHDRFEEVLGEGIFNVDGKKWKLQRKTSSHMFNAKTLNDYMLPV